MKTIEQIKAIAKENMKIPLVGRKTSGKEVKYCILGIDVNGYCRLDFNGEVKKDSINDATYTKLSRFLDKINRRDPPNAIIF